jgi:D-tyrosyl-tRNA(Tyr) deacylase
MKLVIQRVLQAHVHIQQSLFSSIGPGLLVFIGIHQQDTLDQIRWCVNKLIHLRIFSDENGKMNKSIKESQGELLIVSQFTLYGNCLNGRRPDFIQAASPSLALPLYQQFVDEVKKEMESVKTGQFGADMQISLVNDGPVTFVIES